MEEKALPCPCTDNATWAEVSCACHFGDQARLRSGSLGWQPRPDGQLQMQRLSMFLSHVHLALGCVGEHGRSWDSGCCIVDSLGRGLPQTKTIQRVSICRHLAGCAGTMCWQSPQCHPFAYQNGLTSSATRHVNAILLSTHKSST